MRRSPGVAKAADSARRLQATGDVANSLLHLLSQLKAIRYPGHFPATVSELKAKGKCAVLLPILGHLFLGGFSKLVAEKVAHSNPRMFGQSDADFVRSVFLFVKQDFGFRPHLSPQQFLNTERYTEQSLLFVRACADLCRAFHKEEARNRGLPTGKSTRTATSKHGLHEQASQTNATTQGPHDGSTTQSNAKSVPRERPCPMPHAQPSTSLATKTSNPAPTRVETSKSSFAQTSSSDESRNHSGERFTALRPQEGYQDAHSPAMQREESCDSEKQPHQPLHMHRKPELHAPRTILQPELPSRDFDAVSAPNNSANAQSGLSTKLLDLVRKIHIKMESSLEAINARLSLLEARLDRNDTAMSAQANEMKRLFENLPKNDKRRVDPSQGHGSDSFATASVEAKRPETGHPLVADSSSKADAMLQYEGTHGSSSKDIERELVDEGPGPVHQDAQLLVAMIAERIKESHRLLERTRPVAEMHPDGSHSSNRVADVLNDP